MGAEGSYNDDLSRELDRVRSLLGDTNVDDDALLISDTRIDAALRDNGTVNAAAYTIALELLARYAGQPTRAVVNGVTVDYSDRIATWRLLVSTMQVAAAPSSSAISFVPVRYNASNAGDEFSRGDLLNT